MPLCVAIGCYNKSYRKAKGQKNVEQDVEITFHRFPKDEARKLTRIKNMGLRDECLPKSPHLCSLHFSESSFDRSFLMRPRLKENAIPIFKSEITKQQTFKRYREDDNYSDNEIMSKRYSIGQRLEDSPRKKLLRKALSYQKEHFQRQIRTWKQRNKRQEKQIATLNAILKDLKQKSLLADEHADILETIDLAIWARAAAPDGVRRIARTIARTTRQLEDVFKRPTKRWTVGEACGRRGQGINDVLGSSITISDCSRIEDIIIRHNDLRHYTKTNKKHNNI